MRRVLNIMAFLAIVIGVAINVALPPDLDFCDHEQAAITARSTPNGEVSVPPPVSSSQRNFRSHCLLQLPFANAVPVADYDFAGLFFAAGHVRQGKSLAMNDHPPSPLIGPPRQFSPT
jgi:hypothetical protein